MVIGIDVAKAELVIAARPSGERWTVANDDRGVKTLVDRLTQEPLELIVLEATAAMNCWPSPRWPPPRCRWWS